ncbi:MAG: class I SAM-dependent methyltransferase [Puniceicoccales bacterium]|jgi:SAM-dependent methyltransferase|nr:class I SAM-dependent methyltransferase [Puniceicoccales bacterium]
MTKAIQIMIKATQITKNKDTILRENILPNVWWNRFDLRFGSDYDLWEVKSDFGTHFIASHLNGDQIVVSMYLRRISPSIFDEFLKFLFHRYETAKSVYILHSYTMCAGLETMEHAHIEFPKTVEEFDAQLSHLVRYNTKRYPKKIRKSFGDYEIKHWPIADTPQEIHDKYKEFKLVTHGNIDNVAMAMSSEVWAMYIGEDVAAIFQISNTSEGKDLFLVNITYNQKYAKMSPANVLFYAAIKSCIVRGAKRMFLFKMLEYKRHFNAIGTTTWTGTLPREQFIYPHWIEVLTKFPHWTHRTIKFLLLHTRHKRVFSALVHRKQEKWLYLTDSDIGYDNTDRHSLSPSIFLPRIMPVLKKWCGKVFADIGCGDGFVLSGVAPLFKRVIGVEYDLRIAEICRAKKIKNAEIYNIDAVKIPNEIMDAIDVFYIYNPFHGETFERFIENVNCSLARRPRGCLFVYANPTCLEFSNRLQGFKITEEVPAGGAFNVLIYEFGTASHSASQSTI